MEQKRIDHMKYLPGMEVLDSDMLSQVLRYHDAFRDEDFTSKDVELALYDAVAENRSAVEVMGDEVLGQIARDLVAIMQRDVKTDWTVRDDVRAKLRSSIKRLLVKHNYPPDKQPGAVKLVLEQMELLAPRYVAG